MKYIEVGSKVAFKREMTRVVGEYNKNGRSYWILETAEGKRSVPATKIMWNGSQNFVTAEGHQVAESLLVVEEILREVSKEGGLGKSYLVHWLEDAAANLDEKSLGFIVKEVIAEF